MKRPRLAPRPPRFGGRILPLAWALILGVGVFICGLFLLVGIAFGSWGHIIVSTLSLLLLMPILHQVVQWANREASPGESADSSHGDTAPFKPASATSATDASREPTSHSGANRQEAKQKRSEAAKREAEVTAHLTDLRRFGRWTVMALVLGLSALILVRAPFQGPVEAVGDLEATMWPVTIEVREKCVMPIWTRREGWELDAVRLGRWVVGMAVVVLVACTLLRVMTGPGQVQHGRPSSF